MDPFTVGIGALSKLIGLGIKGWNALDDRDFDKDDLEALRALLDVGASTSAKRKSAASGAGALHLALVARAFGRAVGRHQEFHGKLPLTEGLRRWINHADRERQKEIGERVKLAALKVREFGNDPRGEVDHIAALTGPSLGTPYYRELWRAFSDPGLTIAEAGEEPPLVMSSTARSEFERYFLIAYLEGITAAAGGSVDRYLEGLKQYRGVLVRDLLVHNLSTWGRCHVFGNVPRERWNDDESVPFMPLDEIYVEPSGAIHRDGKGQNDQEQNEPLLALIKRLIAANAPAKIIVVAADFGSGKSLSARTLAQQWAEHFLSSPSGSLELSLPIHVRCAEDFPSEKVDLDLTVRRAWKRQASSIGYSVSDEDAAFAWPNTEQRVVCMLDGLDEVALGEQHLRTLFQKLAAKTTRNHRFVIFSRPGALPARKDLGDDVVVVHVQPFDAHQIEQWLGGWNRLRSDHPVIMLRDLEERNLAIVAQTPILLFMLAFTWNQHVTGAEPPSLAGIYEYFFYQVAAGKAEADKEQHGPIGVASDQLLIALQNARILDENARPPDAMLWLMGRVAWEAHMLEQRHPAVQLTRRHIDNLLNDGEVPLPPGAAEVIGMGLILAIQADLRNGNDTILFGHQSFQEFLVGRHWALLLQRIIRGSGRNDRLSTFMLGGRLLASNDRSFDFLMELINSTTTQPRSSSPLSWSDRERELLVRWAQETFEDERQEFGERARIYSRAEPLLRNDRRAELREAALAIGSMVKDSKGLRASDPLTLRSMLACFWLQSIDVKLVAPKANLSGADLGKADLAGADLRESNLSKANLDMANLSEAMLSRANLDHAILSQAKLMMADLRGASLNGADLILADLSGVNLHAADLRHARLVGADLTEGPSGGADLSEANLDSASLHMASLQGADLFRASLRRANLDRAILRLADLRETDLSEASLRGADLRGANLQGAKLGGAILLETKLKEGIPDESKLPSIIFDESTSWPDDFDRSSLPTMATDHESHSVEE